MRIVDVYPQKALNRPGSAATVRVELELGRATHVNVRVELLDLGREVGSATESAYLEAGSSLIEVPVLTPEDDARGYQVRVVVSAEPTHADEPTAEPAVGRSELLGYTALLVAEHWRSVPRYGFLSEFKAGAAADDVVRDLAKFHVTIVQFYDWMYRHYRFLPPKDEGGTWPETFVDAMGREVSPGAVLQRVQQCASYGMAPIAYGAVYGPEPEFILQRPDWLLYDAAGKPLHLIELFYITDLRPGGWREHILREFEAAILEMGFDGIHMDQYGFPKLAYDSGGALVDPSEEFGGLIDEAARRVKEAKPGAGVIFNAVNDWPIDEVASSDQEAVYIEVWSPHDTYADLVRLVTRARDLSGKQTILSAYLLPFHEGGPAAEWALRYATAVIGAAGGHHLVLGEGSAVLREPYYPDHGRLTEEGVRTTRRYYDHTAALTHYLHAPDLRPVAKNYTTGINTAFTLEGAPTSAEPEAGKVWLNVSKRKGQFVLNLVNLTGVTDDLWNVGQGEAPILSGLALSFEPFLMATRITWTSPDEAEGASPIGTELRPTASKDGSVHLELPDLVLWATIVIDYR